MYRVMIVDDEVLVRAWLKKCVNWGECGFSIAAEASNGKEALALLDHEDVDLIFTDIRMPVMDGMELLRAVRKNNARIRFLILTCLDEFQLVQQALELNVSNYILKLTSEPEEIEKELIRVRNYLLEHDGKSKSAGPDKHHGKHVSNARLAAALQYISKHYSEDIDLNIVAQHVGVTPNYLGQVFLQELGNTFTDELNRFRVRESKKLLGDPSIRINDIAAATGFAGTSYFYKVFRKYENCTPTEYRRRKMDDVSV